MAPSSSWTRRCAGTSSSSGWVWLMLPSSSCVACTAAAEESVSSMAASGSSSAVQYAATTATSARSPSGAVAVVAPSTSPPVGRRVLARGQQHHRERLGRAPVDAQALELGGCGVAQVLLRGAHRRAVEREVFGGRGGRRACGGPGRRRRGRVVRGATRARCGQSDDEQDWGERPAPHEPTLPRTTLTGASSLIGGREFLDRGGGQRPWFATLAAACSAAVGSR